MFSPFIVFQYKFVTIIDFAEQQENWDLRKLGNIKKISNLAGDIA